MSTGTSAWAPPTGGVPPQPTPPHNVPPYGWTPPPGGGAPVPTQHGGTPRAPRMWLWALVTAVLMVIAIAAIAAITYAIAHSAGTSTAAAPTPSEPTYTAAQQAAAKQAVCSAFDVSSKGIASQGGARVDGQPNIPMLLRTLSGTVSMQNALVPATPADVAEPARRVVQTNLDLMNAALGQANINEVKAANDASNGAVDALLSACGLPH